jgi:hypothetical protein
MEHRREGCADRVYSVRQESDAHGCRSRAIRLFAVPRQLIPPKALEPIRRQRRVPRRILDIAVTRNACIRLAFWPVQREEIPFVRADLVSRNTLEHLADFFWSETLNNVKPTV